MNPLFINDLLPFASWMEFTLSIFACCGAVQCVVQEFAGQVQVQVEGRRDQGHQLLLLLGQYRPQEELSPRSCNMKT